MNKQEIGKLLTIIKSTLPSLAAIPHIDATVHAWHWLLGDVDYKLAEKATKSVLFSQKIPAWPTPGAIRQAAMDLSCRISSEDEILNEVLSAVHKFGYIGEDKGLNTLSPLARRVSEALGWQYMCSSTEPGVLRGQIRGLYRSVAERVQKDMVMTQIGSGQPVKELSGNSGMLAEMKKAGLPIHKIGNPMAVKGVEK